MGKPRADRPRLPFAPLESYIVWLLRRDGLEPTVRAIAEKLGVGDQVVHSYRKRGDMMPDRADVMAVCAGVHPCYIWGDDWWDACAVDARIDDDIADRKRLATNARKRAWSAARTRNGNDGMEVAV